MSTSKPVQESSIITPWFVGGIVLLDKPYRPFLGTTKLHAFAASAFLAVFILAKLWQGQVTNIVPEPYLDEIFHIPQAQAYCQKQYDVWDPKLTTPPGLYAFAVRFIWDSALGCSVYNLRLFNVFALLMTMLYALDCRTLITGIWKRPSSAYKNWNSNSFSFESIHTAINIALFPPIFFFSGLFYTDVLSTCVVLRAYGLFLQRKGAYSNSGEGLVWIYLTGLVALSMRQTNIFWVAVFMGGLEAVRTIKANATSSSENEVEPKTWQEYITYSFKQYSRGSIHDLPLKDAGVHDFILTALSLAIAILYHPLLTLTRLWPYISLLLSFSAFVFWNGGVVLAKTKTKTPTPKPGNQSHSEEGPTTSFLLILLLTTALSLITAPLVEPRYFILPFVLWRLHLPPHSPSPPTKSHASPSPTSKAETGLEKMQTLVGKLGGYSLHAETLWYLLINAVTGYIFLYRTYLPWLSGPGDVEGPGDRDKGEVECVRGEWSVVNAADVAPFEEVVIVRGCEGEEACCCDAEKILRGRLKTLKRDKPPAERDVKGSD
ncbi:hypothetical protein G7Y89_g8921 [Cudoniella acicularis]|uniref:Dol-P-Glc:Glc(2)Man(9)GlcNAc(2)-PP-Dol alpha-1,2-glucosyltransferase n=1 Tax=Cudoniella acicularis TaxID=354080 RepID=A0A8H4W0L1_9HELO|nr:hypothetical protein G7Y89_g8921 [Cudoniella acicularis]